jgi:hypothetical protein
MAEPRVHRGGTDPLLKKYTSVCYTQDTDHSHTQSLFGSHTRACTRVRIAAAAAVDIAHRSIGTAIWDMRLVYS